MKRKRYTLERRSYWNKLVRKFYHLDEKIKNVMSDDKSSRTEVNLLLERLKKIFRKLKRLQPKIGVKIAGSALALILATSALNAQNYEFRSFPTTASFNYDNDIPAFCDIDNDGKMDLFVGSHSTYITHFEKDGNGAYTFVDTVKAGGNDFTIGSYLAPTFADIDGDGDLDLYIGDSHGYVYFCENNSGSFATPVRLQADGTDIDVNPYTMPVFEDIDGDGDLDLYVGSSSGYINVFLNDGSGNFSANGVLQSASGNIHPDLYTAPAFADIDGDGDVDLLVGYYYGYFGLFLNNGDGTFADMQDFQVDGNKLKLGYYPFPTLVDVDNDGDVDLVSGSDYHYLYIALNDGSGNFTYGGNLQANFRGTYINAVFGDIDNDDDIDLVFGTYDGILEYKKINDDYLWFRTYDRQDTHPNPTLYDIDGDNDLDMLVGTFQGMIQIYTNSGSGDFTLSDSLQADGSDLDVGWLAAPVFGDIDGDGDNDLLVGEFYGYIYYYSNDGSNNFTNNGRLQADGSDITVYYAVPALADIDHDGDIDLVVGDYYGNLWQFKNDGSGTFSSNGYLLVNGSGNINNYNASPTFADIDDDCNVLIIGSAFDFMTKNHETPVPTVETLSQITAECSVDTIIPPYALASCGDSIVGTTDVSFPITENVTVTWTFTDSLGYSSTQTQSVVINDTEAPVADSSNIDIEVQCAITDSLTPPTATDNCVGEVEGTATITYPITSDTSIVWTFADGHGNSSTQTQNIVINDTEAPQITCAGDQTVDADSSHTYTVTGTEFDPLSFSDNCTVDTVYNSITHTSTLAGTSLAEGETIIVWYVSDAQGNTDSCSMTVTVNAYTSSLGDFADLGISVYPNPTNGMLNISQAQGYNLEIIDASGKVIKSIANIDKDNLQIDLSNHAKGVYSIRIYNDKFMKNAKIIVK